MTLKLLKNGMLGLMLIVQVKATYNCMICLKRCLHMTKKKEMQVIRPM